MDEAKAAIAGGTRLSDVPKNPSYLEQLANELVKQRDLIKVLESKLDVVSERLPSEPLDNHTDRPHISTAVQVLKTNNRELDRLINELAL